MASCKKIKFLHGGDESSPQSHPIAKLNRDCLAQIMSYMSFQDRFTAETVCQKWFEASQFAWHTVKFLKTNSPYFHGNFKKKITYHETFTQLLDRCGLYLTKLYVNDNINVSMMPLIRDSCRNLVHLSLDFTKHDEDSFIDAFSEMKKLKSISIRGYSYFPDDYGCLSETEILKSIHQGIEKISILSDESNCILADKFASTLMKFNALNSLTLHCCNLKKPVLDVIRNMATLKCLDLSGSSLHQGYDLFELSKLDNLEHLNVGGLKTDDNFLISVVGKCKKLVYLDASNLPTSVESLIEIGKLQMLKHLDLSGNLDLQDFIINQFRDLEVLCCFRCPFVGDESMIRILTNSPRLKILNVIGTEISTETIRCAIDVTLTRTNGIVLKLGASSDVIDIFRAQHGRIINPFLILGGLLRIA